MMAAKPVFLTKEGLTKLQDELYLLETEKRPRIAAQIQAAKEEGDISENAAYEESKRDQAFVEGRIMTVRAMINNAVVIEHNGPSDKVRLGSCVTVQEDGFDEPVVYHVVGSAEADPLDGRISNESPIGRALMGQLAGSVISYQAPDGEIRLTILNIE